MRGTAPFVQVRGLHFLRLVTISDVFHDVGTIKPSDEGHLHEGIQDARQTILHHRVVHGTTKDDNENW